MDTPNWAEIVTAVATAVTVTFLVWDRFRPRLADIPMSLRFMQSQAFPDVWEVLIEPIPWAFGSVVRLTGVGCRLAPALYGEDGFTGHSLLGVGDWSKSIALDVALDPANHRRTSILVGVQISRSRLPWRRKAEVFATIALTSPHKRLIRSPIPINTAS